jgi:pimeloyl-ACP methyl ester carboxylesterase
VNSSTLPRNGQQGRVNGVDYVVFGDGFPVTVFAHGLAGSISETKPLAMPLSGTRVLFNFRGHGNSDPLPNGWEYDLLADDLRSVADEVGATRACGLSLGAGALLRLLTQTPDRFERLAFVMPAALDKPSNDGAIQRLRDLGQAIESRDIEQLTNVLLAEVPPSLRDLRVTRILLARRAAELAVMTPPAPARVDVPVPRIADLATVTAPAAILAQSEDRLHSTVIAQQLHDALPNSQLTVLEPGGVFWTQPEQTKAILESALTPELKLP